MHYKSIRRLAASLLMALVAVVAMAQDITVSGVVKDNTGQPVPGAAVVVAGTTVGTVTDFDGNYTLAAPSNSTLQVSFIGYATVTEALNGRTTVNFTLHDDAQEIQEVVAVGYGTMKKSDLTGSISSVSTEKLASKGATSVMENLQGAVAGVSIRRALAVPMAASTLRSVVRAPSVLTPSLSMSSTVSSAQTWTSLTLRILSVSMSSRTLLLPQSTALAQPPVSS